jgi:hypothetical protein
MWIMASTTWLMLSAQQFCCGSGGLPFGLGRSFRVRH